ncbi:fosfomycin resistance protein FosB [Rosistilla carotiformis]|uniref:Fosfomycin resistance protein FosB n=1 Tax=Rosistilla carotiformis TaxID=2528017 RepID=A0A518JX75_9BACT|nr:VOC family protein [Rosistilla carotiformis]QDV70157.1 fosfomycin resistance protein FosB [Rosistilla carotiformis]
MKVLQLNHIALHVADVAVSAAFYRDVLQLEPLPRPAFDFPGAWFRLGEDQELHLIGDRDSAVHSASRGNHLALKVDDLDAWESHLQRLGADHNPRRVRPDGGLQVFLPDPDGHWIELLGFDEGRR